MTTAFQGNPVTLAGKLPAVGTVAPDFTLVASDLSEKHLKDFEGKIKVISILPSLDTQVCALSAARFNRESEKLQDVVVLNVSADLPFAASRFCDSNKLSHITTLSTFRSCEFGKTWGVRMMDGPLAGLMARAVVLLDRENKVVYEELVSEITHEPNYAAVLEAIKKL